MDKVELRRLIKEKKRQMTEAEIETASAKLGELFIKTPQYCQAKTIYGYLPYNQEVRTVPILKKALEDGKKIAVPKIYGDEMRFIYLTDFSQLEKNFYGIPEPIMDEPIADDPEALVLMPGLAFTQTGDRMGYGGGFYDKFLFCECDHPTVALCYGFQIVDEIPTDDHDIPVDLVLWA